MLSSRFDAGLEEKLGFFSLKVALEYKTALRRKYVLSSRVLPLLFTLYKLEEVSAPPKGRWSLWIEERQSEVILGFSYGQWVRGRKYYISAPGTIRMIARLWCERYSKKWEI